MKKNIYLYEKNNFMKTKILLILVLSLYSVSCFSQEVVRTKEIKGVVITNQSDPKAIEILKKVKQNYKKNSPKSLDSYEFVAYQKISLDVDKDSIADYRKFISHHQDSLRMAPIQLEQTQEEKKDSLESIQMMNVAKESQFFLWEKAERHLFSKKYGDKIYLLDNRISGLKNPIYEMLTFRTNLYKLPKEIRPENFRLYFYYLKDDILYNGRPNYVIKFRERKNKQFKKKRRYNGYIYIDKATFGITKIESNPKDKTKGSIRSECVLKNGKWFLDNENVKMYFGYQSFEVDKVKDKKGKTKTIDKKYGNYIYLKSKYFDVKVPTTATKKDFRGYTYTVQNTDGSTMSQYRTDTLSARERNAYVKIDSLGNAYKIDKKIGVVTNLLKGRVRTGIVDWNIHQLIGYNAYEGFRIGVGGSLNEKFSKVFSPNGYVAYGFKDEKIKYGVGLDIRTSQNRNALFHLSYADDLMLAGQFSETHWTPIMRLMNFGRRANNNKYFTFKRYSVGYEQDLSNSLTATITAQKIKSKSTFNYQFKDFENNFNDTNIQLALKYAPNSKSVMTPAGKYTYKQGYPQVFLNYQKGIKAVNGAFDYHKFDALLVHRVKTDLGTSKMKLYGGILNGDVPIYNAFEMGGTKGNDWWNFNAYLGFATMEAGKYFSDRFVAYELRHRLPFNFVAWKKGTSNIDLVYRGGIGDFKNKSIHHFNFEKLNHLYQEVGFEYNNVLNTKLGLGFLYRIGAYHQPEFMDNFAIQIKIGGLNFFNFRN